MNQKNNKPWLDETGHPLPIDRLKDVSKSWSPANWEDYLSARETYLQEGLYSNFDQMLLRHDVEASSRQSINDGDTSTGDLFLSERTIRRQLSSLTYQQKLVIEMYFWGSKSLREIAKAMGITRPAVSIHLTRGLSRLRATLAPTLEAERLKIGNRFARGIDSFSQ